VRRSTGEKGQRPTTTGILSHLHHRHHGNDSFEVQSLEGNSIGIGGTVELASGITVAFKISGDLHALFLAKTYTQEKNPEMCFYLLNKFQHSRLQISTSDEYIESVRLRICETSKMAVQSTY
jgi:hypothetical protein